LEYNKYGESCINYLTAENSKLQSIDIENIARTTFGDRSKAGVHMSSATKKIYVPNAKADLETGRIDINEDITINQLSYFGTLKNGSYGAAQGFKDDIMMTIVGLSAYIEKTNEDYVSFVEDAIDAYFGVGNDDDYGGW
jgi:hypothetical protein